MADGSSGLRWWMGVVGCGDGGAEAEGEDGFLFFTTANCRSDNNRAKFWFTFRGDRSPRKVFPLRQNIWRDKVNAEREKRNYW